MSRRMLCIVVPFVVATVACKEAKSPAADSTAVAGARAVVDSTTTAFHQALRTNDSTAFYSYIADDVVMAPPGEGAVRGKDALRVWYSAFLKQYQSSSLTLSDREIFVGDGWATEMGSYAWGLTPVSGGPEAVDHGHYMQVWKRSADGKWQFLREIWNSSGAATP